MKFLCLGYMNESTWETMSANEQEAMIAKCFAYDDELRSGGHSTGEGEPLQYSRTAKTLRCRQGNLIVTDGPYAETKEQLGGFDVIVAEDMNHAVELMSKHPGVGYGHFEIRPIDEELGACCREPAGLPGSVAGGVKFVCLGYGDESKWDALSKEEQEVLLKEYAAYGETLSGYGRWAGGEALKSSKTAKTLRSKGGKVLVTDGPFAETKEQLGGAAIYEFPDMETAVKAWSQHPCLRFGNTLEVRPVDAEFSARFAERFARAEQVT